MPFQYTLANLLAANQDAVAVMFLDETGEAVHVACADYTPYDMKVLGAYIGIYLRQLGEIMGRADLGRTHRLHIEHKGLHFYASFLPDDYYLVLVQRRPALSGAAKASVERARREIAREIFAEPV